MLVVIVRVRVVSRKTVVLGDWRFDYLSGSHLQSQVRVQGSGFRFRVQGSGFRVQGSLKIGIPFHLWSKKPMILCARIVPRGSISTSLDAVGTTPLLAPHFLKKITKTTKHFPFESILELRNLKRFNMFNNLIKTSGKLREHESSAGNPRGRRVVFRATRLTAPPEVTGSPKVTVG